MRFLPRIDAKSNKPVLHLDRPFHVRVTTPNGKDIGQPLNNDEPIANLYFYLTPPGCFAPLTDMGLFEGVPRELIGHLAVLALRIRLQDGYTPENYGMFGCSGTQGKVERALKANDIELSLRARCLHQAVLVKIFGAKARAHQLLIKRWGGDYHVFRQTYGRKGNRTLMQDYRLHQVMSFALKYLVTHPYCHGLTIDPSIDI